VCFEWLAANHHHHHHHDDDDDNNNTCSLISGNRHHSHSGVCCADTKGVQVAISIILYLFFPFLA